MDIPRWAVHNNNNNYTIATSSTPLPHAKRAHSRSGAGIRAIHMMYTQFVNTIPLLAPASFQTAAHSPSV